jgi:hypothetical protein
LSAPPEAALRGPSTAAAGSNASDAQDIEALVRKVVQEIIQQK